jgi:hypothetical protein
LGGQRFVSTIGYSKIHLDLPRIICCVANKLVELFLKKLLIKKKQPQAVKEADIAAAELAIQDRDGLSKAIQFLETLLCSTESVLQIHSGMDGPLIQCHFGYVFYYERQAGTYSNEQLEF